VPQPFSHPEFQSYAFEDIPLDQDTFLMDERWLSDYEAAQIDMFNGRGDGNAGFASYASVHSIAADSLELSWYPNIFTRYHEVSIRLPREAFVTCVDTPSCGGKPCIFVKGPWLSNLHLRPYSAFALIDAIGVKAALLGNHLDGPKLVRLRDRIDLIASANPGVAFISFADNILLKINWFVGQYDSDIHYSYEPETLIKLMPAISDAFQSEIGLKIYGIIVQGVNEYHDSGLLHYSPKGNHVSLNSLGLPFAQLRSIDDAVHRAIHAGTHGPCELYLEEHFYHSLRFKLDLDKNMLPHANYSSPMATKLSKYFYTDSETILKNLDGR